MAPDVSIVVPCFNGERFVEQAIGSALAQDDDLEVIVVDDGSTDSSGAIVQSIARTDPRVKVCVEPNRGPAHARNVGVRAMSPTSRYLLFLDADDVLAPNAIPILRRRLEREPGLGAVFGSRSRIDHTGTQVEQAPVSVSAYFADDQGVRRLDSADEIGYWHFMPVNPISTPGQCLIRVSALPSGEVFDRRYPPCEDWELWLRLARHHVIGVEHHEVISYRDHDASASKSYGVMYEQREAVYGAQCLVITPEELQRFKAAWRFGLFRFDAGLCLDWAQARFAERDLRGSVRFLLRSIRYRVRYRWAVLRREPDIEVGPT